MMTDDALFLARIERWRAVLHVRFAGTQDFIHEAQQSMCNCNQRGPFLVLARFRHDPPELLFEKAVPLGRGCAGAFHQLAAQPWIAPRRMAALVLARAAVIARAKSCPGSDILQDRKS